MPTLIVEDGTGVANANTYADESYLATYASDRGYAIPGSVQLQQQYLLQAMDYLFYFTDKWVGTKTDDANSLDWPRQDGFKNSVEIPSDSIPAELLNAQCQLVVELEKGTLLFPAPLQSTTEGLVIQKTVDVMTKKFTFNGLGVASSHRPIKIMSVWVHLNPLFKFESLHLKTYRA